MSVHRLEMLENKFNVCGAEIFWSAPGYVNYAALALGSRLKCTITFILGLESLIKGCTISIPRM